MKKIELSPVDIDFALQVIDIDCIDCINDETGKQYIEADKVVELFQEVRNLMINLASPTFASKVSCKVKKKLQNEKYKFFHYQKV